MSIPVADNHSQFDREGGSHVSDSAGLSPPRDIGTKAKLGAKFWKQETNDNDPVACKQFLRALFSNPRWSGTNDL